MADLDDFFAKKDRKRSKGKPKQAEVTLSSDVLTTLKKSEPAAAAANNTTTTSSSSQDQPAVSAASVKPPPAEEEGEEEEWIDFKVEEQKDYTGLKLQQLTIEEKPKKQENSEPSDVDKAKAEQSQLAWKSVPATTPAPAAPAPVKEIKEELKSVYVSPGLRNSGVMGGRPRLKNTVAPDLSSADYFPALGATPKPEPVKGTLLPSSEARRQASLRQQQLVSNPVTLGNRFNTLDTDDS